MNNRRPCDVCLLWALVSLAVVSAGCRTQEENPPDAPGAVVMNQQEQEEWEIALVEMRITRNEEFADSTRTPLPPEALADFQGLNYFYPEPGLRFRTPLIAAAGADTVVLVKRKGQQVPYRRRGLVRFRYQDRNYQLAVFGPVDTTGGDYLWLPFYDQTTGEKTYAGGRYLDLTVDKDGMVDLDFNYAYNPLCDYNPDQFNCTLPPPENRLPFPVEAGEQTFGTAH